MMKYITFISLGTRLKKQLSVRLGEKMYLDVCAMVCGKF